MKKLLKQIENLKKSKVKRLVDSRIKEFGQINKNKIFQELCFCILTANFNAERCIKIQKELNKGFLTLSQKEIANELKKLGHRYPNTRAKYLVKARRCKKELDKILKSKKKREWLVKNIKGLGYKESSHFLRNIGYKDFAIIDFHIMDLLVKYNLIKRPKTLTKKKYLEIEKLLGKIAKKARLSLAELDLYLWYMETGKVLK